MLKQDLWDGGTTHKLKAFQKFYLVTLTMQLDNQYQKMLRDCEAT